MFRICAVPHKGKGKTPECTEKSAYSVEPALSVADFFAEHATALDKSQQSYCVKYG